ncbi:MAG: Hpt domain-containing protein [Lachnospiraceae bacterium]|nr:Hpt domain-containing protein [Lachnospiraceae bacterium]
MITIDGLRAFGAGVDEGLARCMNNEAFYVRLVEKVLKDKGFDELDAAVAAHDTDAAFEAAHKLKGVLANLALTPICEPVTQMVELLRNRTDTDYSQYMNRIKEKKAQLEGML